MQQARKPRSVLAWQEGLEPPTTGFGDRDSGQLSYCPLLSSYRRPLWTVQPVRPVRTTALGHRGHRDVRRPCGGVPDGEGYVAKRHDVEPWAAAEPWRPRPGRSGGRARPGRHRARRAAMGGGWG